MWDLRLTEAETRAVLDALERMASARPAAFETKLLGPLRSRLSARVAVWDANTARRAHREIAAMADEIEPDDGPEGDEDEGDGPEGNEMLSRPVLAALADAVEPDGPAG